MTTSQRRLDDLPQRTTTSLKKPVVTGEIDRREAYSLLREFDLCSIGSDASMSASEPSEPLTRADVLTAAEASRLLGIPRSTLYALARRNELPARQIGRRWIFRRSLLERATLPLTEPDCWRRTFGSPSANRNAKSANRCPRTLPAQLVTSSYKPDFPSPRASATKRTTGLEPATFGLGSQRSTN